MLDSRLAQPKDLSKVGDGFKLKFYKNSNFVDQKLHQNIFKGNERNY